MENVNDLPLMTRDAAYKANVQYFRVKKPCKDCGTDVFYRPQPRQIMTLCLECYPDIKHTSLCKINAAENKHNRQAKKAWNSRVCIPVVFGGMNTK